MSIIPELTISAFHYENYNSEQNGENVRVDVSGSLKKEQLQEIQYLLLRIINETLNKK